MEPDVIRSVVSQHEELGFTRFSENPLLLYSTAELSLMSIDANLTLAHFVLTIPLIQKNEPVYSLFETSQVGSLTAENKNMCRLFNIPRYLYSTKSTILFTTLAWINVFRITQCTCVLKLTILVVDLAYKEQT